MVPPLQNPVMVPVPAGASDGGAPPGGVAETPPAAPVKAVRSGGVRVRGARQDSEVPQAQLPEELRFLAEPRCNPNLRDSAVRKQGYMRQVRTMQAQATTVSNTKMQGRTRRWQMVRQIIGFIILSAPMQAVMIAVILVDCVVTIMQLSHAIRDGEHETLVMVTGYCVVVFLTLDVIGRWIAEGWNFLRNYLNLLELLLVPITIVDVFLLQDMNAPVPIIRALRPVLRGLRILRILVRTAGKGTRYLAYMRRQVSGDRTRFTQDGFDLDLAYMSAQIIAMSLPGAGYERLLHNPYTEVAGFLNERHGNKYLLVNTTHEQRYPLKPFFGRYYHFPIEHQGVPVLEDFWRLCEILDMFLKADQENVLAIHSHHGQGRVSMVVIALLLYRGTCPTVTASIAHVEHNRTSSQNDGESTTQTLDNSSQKRFLEYFGQMCLNRATSSGKANVRPAKLRRITLHGLSNVNRLDVKCFPHPTVVTAQGLDEGPVEFSREESGAGTPSEKSVAGSKSVDTFYKHTSDCSMTMSPEVRGTSKLSLVERAMKVINESTLDSVQAGCTPMLGRPQWASATSESCFTRGHSLQTGANGNMLGQPAIWELKDDLHLPGEFRLEFHRRAISTPQKVLIRKSQKERMKRQGKRCVRCCFCCYRRRVPRQTTQESLARVHSGMLFASWFHAGFLEHDEPMDGANSKRTSVVVELDRFALDKAANAPTMRSYSTGLKVVLDFDVPNRIEWSQAEDELQDVDIITVPPSAHMSESYSLEWLTWVSKRVWPSFNNAFESLIRNNVMPSLKESMPGPLKNIRLAQCSFGNDFPRFGHITASSRTMDGLEVQLDIPLSYQPAVNIVLDAGLVSFGISRLQLSGVLSLRFKPILAELPVFSAMQLLFLNLPEVDLRFARNLEIANSSRVRNLIFGAINKGLCDLMVLPNIININWADPNDDGSVSFRNVLPCSILRLRVIEAKDLSTESSMFKRAPDTFVKVQLGAQVTQTPVISKNNTPVWNSEFDFLVYDQQQHLTATVMDVDYSGRTHSLGSVQRLPVLQVAAAGTDGQWLPLKKMSSGGSSRTSGDLLIAGQMFDLDSDAETLEGYINPQGRVPSPRRVAPAANSEKAAGSAAASAADFEDPEDVEEPEELEEPEGGTDLVPTQFRSGTSAILIVEVFGGHCPIELAAASALDVKIALGKVEDKRRCVDAQKVDPGSVSDKAKKSLEKLAAMGLDATAIAESLGEDINDVQRIMRKHGWNLELPQKLCLLLSEADLAGATNIEVSVHLKKKCLGTTSVRLTSVLQAPNLKHTEVVCLRSNRHRSRVELDAEFRMFVLRPQSVDL